MTQSMLRRIWSHEYYSFLTMGKKDQEEIVRLLVAGLIEKYDFGREDIACYRITPKGIYSLGLEVVQ